jgi:fibronectin-binding autotransporter adhesin
MNIIITPLIKSIMSLSEDSYYIDATRTRRTPDGLMRQEVVSKIINFSPSFNNDSSNFGLNVKINVASPAEIIAGTDNNKIVTAEGLMNAGFVPGGSTGVQTVTANTVPGVILIDTVNTTSTDIVLKNIVTIDPKLSLVSNTDNFAYTIEDTIFTSIGGLDSMRMQNDGGANITIQNSADGGNILINPFGDMTLNSGHDFFMGGNFVNAGYLSANGFVSDNATGTLVTSDNVINITPNTNSNAIVNLTGTSKFVVDGIAQINDNLLLANGTIENSSLNGNIVLAPNGTGHVSANSAQIKDLASPTSASDAANKAYVDAVALGFGPKLAVRGKTTLAEANAILAGGAVSFSGTGQGKTITKLAPFAAFSVDSIAGLAVNDRILFAGGTLPSEHYGIYVITNLGSGGSAWVLTRASDADNSPTNGEVAVGIYTFITEGTDHGYQGWALITFAGSLDVDAQTWSAVTQAGGGITTITPTITGAPAGAFVTDGGTPVNTLSIDTRLFNAIGTTSTSGTLLIGNIGQTNLQTFISGGPNGGTFINTSTDGAVVIGNNTTAQLDATSAASMNLTGTPININQNNGGIVNIGAGTNANAINIGNNTGTKTISVLGGASGSLSINANAAGSLTNVGTGSTTGTISIGGLSNIVNIKSGATSNGVNILTAASGSGGNILNLGSASSNTGGMTINIGTSALAGTISIGTNSGSLSTVIANGTTTGDCSIGGNANNVNIKNGATSGVIGIAVAAGTTTTNIGTSTTTGTITIGNTGAAFNGVALIGGAGGISINGNSSSTGQVSIGTGVSTGTVAIGGDTNNVNIKDSSTGGGIVNIGTSRNTTSGTINIGSNATVAGCTINIGNSANNTVTRIGTGTTTGAVNIGNLLTQSMNLISSPSFFISLNSVAGSGSVEICNNSTAGNAFIGGNGGNTVFIKLSATSGSATICQDGAASTFINNASNTGSAVIGGLTNTIYLKSHPSAPQNPTSGSVLMANNAGSTTVSIGTGSTTGTVTLGSNNNAVISPLSTVELNAKVNTHIVNKQWVIDNFMASTIARKENIEPLVDSSSVLQLNAKAFTIKETGNNTFGLIAEEVETIYPKLCAYNNAGELEGVKYHLLAVLLLEEIKKLKEEIEKIKNN